MEMKNGMTVTKAETYINCRALVSRHISRKQPSCMTNKVYATSSIAFDDGQRALSVENKKRKAMLRFLSRHVVYIPTQSLGFVR